MSLLMDTQTNRFWARVDFLATGEIVLHIPEECELPIRVLVSRGGRSTEYEPSNSENPNNSTKATISKMEQVDEPQIYCDTCGLNKKCKTAFTAEARHCQNESRFGKDEPQTNKDFKVTYTCSFTECDNFKNFGFGEKCIECKRKQSEAKHKDEPQTDCAWK